MVRIRTAACRCRPYLVAVAGITDATAIAAGGDESCADVPGGSVVCWGWNGTGALGDGTTSNSSVPVKVSGVTTATAIACGGGHTCCSRTVPSSAGGTTSTASSVTGRGRAQIRRYPSLSSRA